VNKGGTIGRGIPCYKWQKTAPTVVGSACSIKPPEVNKTPATGPEVLGHQEIGGFGRSVIFGAKLPIDLRMVKRGLAN